jgi:hypothetical protein
MFFDMEQINIEGQLFIHTSTVLPISDDHNASTEPQSWQENQ